MHAISSVDTSAGARPKGTEGMRGQLSNPRVVDAAASTLRVDPQALASAIEQATSSGMRGARFRDAVAQGTGVSVDDLRNAIRDAMRGARERGARDAFRPDVDRQPASDAGVYSPKTWGARVPKTSDGMVDAGTNVAKAPSGGRLPAVPGDDGGPSRLPTVSLDSKSGGGRLPAVSGGPSAPPPTTAGTDRGPNFPPASMYAPASAPQSQPAPVDTSAGPSGGGVRMALAEHPVAGEATVAAAPVSQEHHMSAPDIGKPFGGRLPAVSSGDEPPAPATNDSVGDGRLPAVPTDGDAPAPDGADKVVDGRLPAVTIGDGPVPWLKTGDRLPLVPGGGNEAPILVMGAPDVELTAPVAEAASVEEAVEGPGADKPVDKPAGVRAPWISNGEFAPPGRLPAQPMPQGVPFTGDEGRLPVVRFRGIDVSA